jgi:hypothetical protein
VTPETVGGRLERRDFTRLDGSKEAFDAMAARWQYEG